MGKGLKVKEKKKTQQIIKMAKIKKTLIIF
jgi:hypothetical protein